MIIVAVRWYLWFNLSYRGVEELLVERGIEVDHVTVYGWVQRFTPLLADAAPLVDIAPDLTADGEAATGTEAVVLATRERPDVVLMDIRMPDLDGIEATRRICAEPATAGVRVSILTTFDIDEYVFTALRAGASGFLLKDTRPADLIDAIRVAAAGDALLAPGVTRRLIAEFTRTPEPSQRPVTSLAQTSDHQTAVALTPLTALPASAFVHICRRQCAPVVGAHITVSTLVGC